jgi:hypothetical protein
VTIILQNNNKIYKTEKDYGIGSRACLISPEIPLAQTTSIIIKYYSEPRYGSFGIARLSHPLNTLLGQCGCEGGCWAFVPRYFALSYQGNHVATNDSGPRISTVTFTVDRTKGKIIISVNGEFLLEHFDEQLKEGELYYGVSYDFRGSNLEIMDE